MKIVTILIILVMAFGIAAADQVETEITTPGGYHVIILRESASVPNYIDLDDVCDNGSYQISIWLASDSGVDALRELQLNGTLQAECDDNANYTTQNVSAAVWVTCKCDGDTFWRRHQYTGESSLCNNTCKDGVAEESFFILVGGKPDDTHDVGIAIEPDYLLLIEKKK